MSTQVQVLVDAFGGGVLPEFSECPAPLFLVHACRARQRLGAHILPTLTRHRGHSSTCRRSLKSRPVSLVEI